MCTSTLEKSTNNKEANPPLAEEKSWEEILKRSPEPWCFQRRKQKLYIYFSLLKGSSNIKKTHVQKVPK
jgi:hypothetical protein